MPQFNIYRSQEDAHSPGTHYHGHLIDPDMGRWGGFLLDTIETEDPNIYTTVKGQPKPVVLKRRKVLASKEVTAANGKHTVYTCEPEREDAEWLCSIRPKWRYEHAMTEDEMRAKLHKLDEAPVEYTGNAAIGESQAGYRALQARVRKVKEAGGPDIPLKTSKKAMEKYLAAYEQAAAVPA